MIDDIKDVFERFYKGKLTHVEIETDSENYELAREYRIQVVGDDAPCSVKLVPGVEGLHLIEYYGGCIRPPYVEKFHLVVA